MLIAAVGATIFIFAALARTASAPPMSLLFSGLNSRDAGKVIAALERSDVAFDIRGDAIYVPSSKRDSVRMTLAGEGLPEQGQAGYELLDNLNGFSTTSEMFDATYWRAKEGELARTILATPGVSAARVHIANQHTSAFARNAPAPTAVVTVTTGQTRLQESQAMAIRFLIASAVPALAADQVAVIDSERGVILSPGKSDMPFADQKGTADREQKLESDILDLLEARVGRGNARVQIAMDIDMERESVSEITYNPDGRVISGKETTEVSETSTGGATGGAVTVASNLPEGDAAAAGPPSRTERTENKETIDYGMSEIKRQSEKFPGSIRRLSIAVFVNQVAEQAGEEGGDPVLRDAAELETLRALVANAAGFEEERGDTLTIQTLPFQPIANNGVLVEDSPIGDFLQQHLMAGVQIVILSIVTLILGLFVVKPLLSTSGAPLEQLTASPTPAAPAVLDSARTTTAGEITADPPDAITTLKEIASSKSDQTAELIKSWLETSEDAA